jgi:hypothetical protein
MYMGPRAASVSFASLLGVPYTVKRVGSTAARKRFANFSPNRRLGSPGRRRGRPARRRYRPAARDRRRLLAAPRPQLRHLRLLASDNCRTRRVTTINLLSYSELSARRRGDPSRGRIGRSQEKCVCAFPRVSSAQPSPSTASQPKRRLEGRARRRARPSSLRSPAQPPGTSDSITRRDEPDARGVFRPRAGPCMIQPTTCPTLAGAH